MCMFGGYQGSAPDILALDLTRITGSLLSWFHLSRPQFHSMCVSSQGR